MSEPSPCRLGFLGLLHMEVFNQRLEQEYNASVIVTAPTVPYKAVLSSAKLIKVRAIFLLVYILVLTVELGRVWKDVEMIDNCRFSGIACVLSCKMAYGSYLTGQSKCSVAKLKSQPL